MFDLLEKLSEAPGISGQEEAVRQILRDELSGLWDREEMDTMGNLIVTTGENLPGPRAMIAAHMDEIGLIVDWIDEKGYLRFQKVGGIDDRILPSTRVRVGESGTLGVIGILPHHLTKESERESPVAGDDLMIDIGATSRDEAEQYVQIGDQAVFDSTFRSTPSGTLIGKALDDRAGCALAAAIAKTRAPLPTYFAFTVQEEIGLRGAKVAAERIRPDFAIVLEATTCADMPDPDSRRRSTKQGDGAVLTFQDSSSIPHPGLLKLLTRVAEETGVPYQWKTTTAGGNDAGSIHTAAGGIPTIVVSLPCRYIHAPYSSLQRKDMESVLKLIPSFLERIARDGVPHRTL